LLNKLVWHLKAARQLALEPASRFGRHFATLR
jgi:hypothetical protein